MILDYGTLLSPTPIKLLIGTLRNPTLRQISELTFPKFGMFQVYLKMTPEQYYTQINKDKIKYWETLLEDQQNDMTVFDVLLIEKDVRHTYLEILNFFFEERIIFRDKLFMVIDTDDYKTADHQIGVTQNNLRGIIHEKIFLEILDILQQICCIKNYDELESTKPVFKNNKAKRLWERMLKAGKEKEEKDAKKNSANLTLPNIISATAAKSTNLNIITIWDTTLFQLYDQFGRIQNNDAHLMNCTRVAVWGDEKKKFDPTLWYKNIFDKKNS